MTARPRPGHARQDERGAVLILTVLALLFIVAAAAVAIDLAAVRNDRADNQVAADSAVTAGILAYTEDGGQVACQTALDYLVSNTGYTMTGADCSSFPERCKTTTPSATTTGVVGALTITITHPVDDSDPLMRPGAIGAPDLGVTAADGDRCGRLGVSITEVHQTFFGGVIDVDQLTSVVHAVALDGTDRSPARMANLIVLERHDCNALAASNGSGDGGIILGAVTDASGQVHPGRVSVDSDAGSGCGPEGTIDVNGTNGLIRADGPPGCPNEVGPPGSGQGCGIIETFAPGPPGCLMPACSNTGVIQPAPVQMDRRITRAALDHRWNCKASYPPAYDIDGCLDTSVTPPYIDQLTAAVGPGGTPPGFNGYTAAGHPCSLGASDIVTVPPGNWVVDCKLKINGSLTFAGGNVVFNKEVAVQSDGSLTVNNANPDVYSWTEGTNLDHTESSSDAAYAYFRAEQLKKNGQGSITFRSTMVYLAPGVDLEISGGSGVLDWSAPTEGPFRDLALWSDSDQTNDLGGQTNMVMEGIFFAPLATLRFTGNSIQQQVAAQYVVNKLHVSGQGALVIAPDADRGVAFPLPWPTVLIR